VIRALPADASDPRARRFVGRARIGRQIAMLESRKRQYAGGPG